MTRVLCFDTYILGIHFERNNIKNIVHLVSLPVSQAYACMFLVMMTETDFIAFLTGKEGLNSMEKITLRPFLSLASQCPASSYRFYAPHFESGQILDLCENCSLLEL